MNAQEAWSSWYYKWRSAITRKNQRKTIWSRRCEMYRYRREAALERKLEAAQRRIAQLESERDPAMAEDGNEWEKQYYLRGMHR